ncbi:MAG: hypothetical protein PHC52_06325 [Syntrophales bacterium]|jgi:hypothetical protein|nr:hypothetical protein [Syntrophales bacterium]
MPTVFDLEQKAGTWFEMDGGGRIQIHVLTPEEFKEVRRQTVKKKVDFKKVDGTPARLPYEEVNEDLQNELFWDACIVAWENLFDGKGKEIPCTKENKVLLMMRSQTFARFVAESIETLTKDQAQQAEQAEKN